MFYLKSKLSRNTKIRTGIMKSRKVEEIYRREL